MTGPKFLCACVAIVFLAASGTAAAQDGAGVGIKGGFVFPSFDSANDFDLDGKIGWQAGVFFGGNRDGVVGVQGEVNFLRKNAESDFVPGLETTIDYIQIPVMLRLHTPSQSAAGFQIYGIAGPSFDFRIRESIEGLDSDLENPFETFDIALIVGGGIEFGTLILEGRYQHGFRRINDMFNDVDEIKGRSFAALAGFRFN
jgi:Outer membrane protein beta-barrel domain